MNSVLVVCTGNICRSPVGEAALRALLPGTFTVSSAGTHAMVGSSAAPEAARFLEREFGTGIEHTARQLTREITEGAQLIVAMTTEQRTQIARIAPRTVRRTFTLRELAQIVPDVSGIRTMHELTAAASRKRTRVSATGGNLDIEDPYRRPPEVHEAAYEQVLVSSRLISDALCHIQADD